MSTKYVYTFGDGKAEGKADMRNLLGGKGANLAEMNLIGVPVPAGFTITTEVCTLYNQEGKVVHLAPPAKLVLEQLEQLFDWMKESSTNMLIKSSIFHYEFEFIHPANFRGKQVHIPRG